MRKQSAKTTKIIKYLEENPGAKAAAVAKKFDVHVSRVYQLRKKVLDAFVKEFIDGDDVPADPTPMPTAEQEAASKAASILREASLTAEQRKARVKKYFVEPTSVDGVLDSRAQDYGAFKDGAALMQSLKRTLADHAQRHNKTFADDQWEALEMIIHKVGRIVNGNPDKVDHWTDIAGYAKLVADRLEGRVR